MYTPSNRNVRILFVTWDGPQVNYLEGLFLPIFKQLKKFGFHFHILQFTWGGSDRTHINHLVCKEAGIPYQAITIWRRPRGLGALLTVLLHSRTIRHVIRNQGIDIIMPRSILPGLSALLALRNTSLQMIFDADGLPLDERVDFAGLSSSSVTYRLLRDIEAQAVRKADAVLTRSSVASRILLDRAGSETTAEKFHVVMNGRDSVVFSPGNKENRAAIRKNLGIPLHTPLIVYAGSVGSQYCMNEMFTFFRYLLSSRHDAHFLFLTGSPDSVLALLDSLRDMKESMTVRSVSAHDVPNYLAAADVGLALRRPSFSMQAVSPIKLGEYLLCGLPVIATRGIGDTSLFVKEHVGFLIDDACDDQLEKAATWFINKVLKIRNTFRERCRTEGVKHFSLDQTVKKYRYALESVIDA
ncbi:MAG: glycosyltransferase [Candidatus Electrothrix sp. AW3_4]|nr:glycosyltransferase [Candidatus Electrothrix gigas]